MVLIYEFGNPEKLTPHFDVKEFDCKCGERHGTKLDTNLLTIGEKLFTVLDCSKIIVVSGYRCTTHDKAVGGSGTGFHTMGQAMDIRAYDKKGNKIPSAKVACALEDMGVYGIGLNCGGNEYNTHADTRPASRKWFGDEKLSGSPSIEKYGCKSFHEYCGIPKASVRNIKIGSSGTDVKALQSALIARGYSCGSCGADGMCGVYTADAIRRFQSDSGLEVDGIAGVLTQGVLFS